MGAWLFSDDGPSGSGLGKTLQGLEDNMMSGVFPRQGGEGGFFFQILHFLCRKALTSKQEPTLFPDLVSVEVELPRAVPPKMGFDLHGVSERVGAGKVVFFDGKGAGLLATVEGSVFHLSRQGGVDRVKAVGKLNVEADASAV